MYVDRLESGHFLLLIFDDFESSLTILSLMHLVFIMGRSPLDMSLKRVSAMGYVLLLKHYGISLRIIGHILKDTVLL